MLYSICIGLILVASIILILAVLVQNPKSGMAANFGAANQVMGVRESANILERTTWWLAGIIVALSLVATASMDADMNVGKIGIENDANALMEKVGTTATIPQAEVPASEDVIPATPLQPAN
ncbi:MAG: preprotein translocase subunit SecG [Alistipes sp.]|nr:preprotein translocase subunit SecG [Alistipes sp.]